MLRLIGVTKVPFQGGRPEPDERHRTGTGGPFHLRGRRFVRSEAGAEG